MKTYSAKLEVRIFIYAVLLGIYCSSVYAADTDTDAVASNTPNTIHTPTPQNIELLMKQQFKVINVAKPKTGWFSWLFGPLPELKFVATGQEKNLAGVVDSSYKVRAIEPADDGLFQHEKIFSIVVDEPFLEIKTLPSCCSVGMFAFDGEKLTYLNGTQYVSNVMGILKQEHRSLEQFNPEALAKFFIKTILVNGNYNSVLVKSPGDVLNFENSEDSPGSRYAAGSVRNGKSGYIVSRAELEKVSKEIHKPIISGNKKKGWKLSFTILYGWMHHLDNLERFDLSISPTFDLKSDKHILSEKIFSQVPSIEY